MISHILTSKKLFYIIKYTYTYTYTHITKTRNCFYFQSYKCCILKMPDIKRCSTDTSRVKVKRIHPSIHGNATGGGACRKGILCECKIAPRMSANRVHWNYLPLFNIESYLTIPFFFLSFSTYIVDKNFLTTVVRTCNSFFSNDNAGT